MGTGFWIKTGRLAGPSQPYLASDYTGEALHGEGAPSDDLGDPGDGYLNTRNDDVFEKQGFVIGGGGESTGTGSTIFINNSSDGDDGWPGMPGMPGAAGVGTPGAAGESVRGPPGVGEDGEDAWPIPGPRGAAGESVRGPPGFGEDGDDGWPGAPGKSVQGERGLTVPGQDGEDGDSWPTPGRSGIDGLSITGQTIPGQDGEDGDSMPTPGRSGIDGFNGQPGALIPLPGCDGEDAWPIPGPRGERVDGLPGYPGRDGEDADFVWPIAGKDGAASGIPYIWTTSNSGDPGSGKFGLNNAVFSGVGAINISRQNRNNIVVAIILQDLLNSGTNCEMIFKNADGSKYISLIATASLTDNSTYYTVSVNPRLMSTGIIAGDVFYLDLYKVGTGVPAGGTTGQFLKKNSATDYDTSWFDLRNPLLTADATYYVRTDGSDSNTGLANTAGGAFLTIQKAIDTASKIDASGFKITIQIADGTYTSAGNTLKNVTGFSGPGNCVIQGNNATPANVVVSSSTNCFLGNSLSTVWDIKDLKLTATASGILSQGASSNVRFGNIDFGACSTHLLANAGGSISALSNYKISGGGLKHYYAVNGGLIDINSVAVNVSTLTIANTPAFSEAFAVAFGPSTITCYGITFAGTSATGPRYSGISGGYIFTNAGGPTYLPGSTAGSATTGYYT